MAASDACEIERAHVLRRSRFVVPVPVRRALARVRDSCHQHWMPVLGHGSCKSGIGRESAKVELEMPSCGAYAM
jgi:hypothetical protein